MAEYNEYIANTNFLSMLKTSKLLTITVPKATYARIRVEASRRKSSISGLLRDAFDSYITYPPRNYTNAEIQDFINRDRLSPKLRKKIDTFLAAY
jgi:hypothetical protein